MAAATDIAVDFTLPAVLRHNAPDGSYMDAIDVLAGAWPLVEEGYWVQANDDTSHQFLRMSYEPVGSFVRYNEGTSTEAVGEVPVTEQLGRLESMLKVDSRILEKAKNPIRYRRDMEAAFVRGLVKTFTKTAFGTRDATSGPFYGNMGKDPKTVNGLTTRYNALTTAASPVDNVRSLSGAGANVESSIWLVKHGPQGLFFLYPRTSSRLLEIRDLRENLARDANAKEFLAVYTRFAWEFGLGIADERNVQRLCNITTSGASTDFGAADNTSAQGENALIDMIERLPGGDTSGCVFYAGPAIMAAMRKRLNTKANMFFTVETVWGRPQLTFMGIPVVRCDALTANEAVVS